MPMFFSAVIAAWVLLTPSSHADATAQLGGRVTSGALPVAGATVMVWRAWPIEGLAYYCPGCYRDCGRTATTDADGHWSITGLDDTLKFELLVVADGQLPCVSGVTNPAKRPTLDVAMTTRDPGSLTPEQTVRGRVLNAAGEPVKHAIVFPKMVYTSEGGRGGAVKGLDPLAVTDEDGRFMLAYERACDTMDLSVSARGYAVTCFPGRSSGGREHELGIVEGAAVSGRLLRDGRPVPDVDVTLVVDQRARYSCFDRQTLATDENGRFVFTGVLPGQGYFLTASTQQLLVGCVAPTRLSVATGEVEVDAGDLAVIRGVRIAGRVLAPKDRAIPAGSKISLSAEPGWDGVTVDLAPDGAFMFPEIAPGEVSISLHAPGIYVSHRNPSADKLNENRLVGTVTANISNIEIETTSERPSRPVREEDRALPELGGIENRHGGRR